MDIPQKAHEQMVARCARRIDELIFEGISRALRRRVTSIDQLGEHELHSVRSACGRLEVDALFIDGMRFMSIAPKRHQIDWTDPAPMSITVAWDVDFVFPALEGE